MLAQNIIQRRLEEVIRLSKEIENLENQETKNEIEQGWKQHKIHNREIMMIRIMEETIMDIKQ